MFFFAEKRKASRLITLLLVFMILYLLFLLSLRTGKTSISHFYLYERRFSPVELPLSELKSLNESFRSFETRAVKFPQTFNGNDITQDNLIGGFWPSGKLFMDLHWKNVKAVSKFSKTKHLFGPCFLINTPPGVPCFLFYY